MREAEEEIALDPSCVEVLGRLGDYVTGTGYRITPVLGLLPPGLALRPAPARLRRSSNCRSTSCSIPPRHIASVITCGATGANTGFGRIPIITSGARLPPSSCTWRRSCGLWGHMLRLVELALFVAPLASLPSGVRWAQEAARPGVWWWFPPVCWRWPRACCSG